MEIELAKNQTGLIQNVDELSRIGKMMSMSGYFEDARDAAKAAVKISAGMELGFGPFASMTGIHIIKGRPAIGANLMAAAVKANPRYDYRVTKMSDEEVVIDFYERIDGKPEKIGVSSFSAKDATKAWTQNMGKFPRNMLFARAISNGIKWYCPDVFNGNTTYVPEELGATVDDEGNVLSVPETAQNALEQPVAVEADATPITAPSDEEKPVKASKKAEFDEMEFLRNWSAPADVAQMSRLNAEKMLDSKGHPYGEKSTYELFNMLRVISKKIDTLTPEQKPDYQLKVSAICEILQCRKVEKTTKKDDEDPFVGQK